MKKHLWAVVTKRGALIYAGGQVLAFFTKSDAKQSWMRYQIPETAIREVVLYSVLLSLYVLATDWIDRRAAALGGK